MREEEGKREGERMKCYQRLREEEHGGGCEVKEEGRREKLSENE